MAYLVKAPADKPDSLSSIPRTPVAVLRQQTPVNCPLTSTQVPWCARYHTTHTNKKCKKKLIFI